ncbi:hypothetical protein C8R47DRAFT_1068140 [Mycena vitilis]|nr:hypothetical protein C8R47DRAFT_1068140 [Mycena vitilis]
MVDPSHEPDVRPDAGKDSIVPSSSEYDPADALRKVYQHVVQIPVHNVEQLWARYGTFEAGLDRITAQKLTSDLSPAHMRARNVLDQLTIHLDGLRSSDRSSIILPPLATFVRSSASLSSVGKRTSSGRREILWELRTAASSSSASGRRIAGPSSLCVIFPRYGKVAASSVWPALAKALKGADPPDTKSRGKSRVQPMFVFQLPLTPDRDQPAGGQQRPPLKGGDAWRPLNHGSVVFLPGYRQARKWNGLLGVWPIVNPPCCHSASYGPTFRWPCNDSPTKLRCQLSKNQRANAQALQSRQSTTADQHRMSCCIRREGRALPVRHRADYRHAARGFPRKLDHQTVTIDPWHLRRLASLFQDLDNNLMRWTSFGLVDISISGVSLHPMKICAGHGKRRVSHIAARMYRPHLKRSRDSDANNVLNCPIRWTEIQPRTLHVGKQGSSDDSCQLNGSLKPPHLFCLTNERVGFKEFTGIAHRVAFLQFLVWEHRSVPVDLDYLPTPSAWSSNETLHWSVGTVSVRCEQLEQSPAVSMEKIDNIQMGIDRRDSLTLTWLATLEEWVTSFKMGDNSKAKPGQWVHIPQYPRQWILWVPRGVSESRNIAHLLSEPRQIIKSMFRSIPSLSFELTTAKSGKHVGRALSSWDVFRRSVCITPLKMTSTVATEKPGSRGQL